MKRYRFALEPVLRVRRAQEEQARSGLALANRQLRTAEEALAASTEAYRRLPVPCGVVDVAALALARLHGDLGAAEMDRRRKLVDEAVVAAVTRHAQWTEAARRVAALERIDEHRRAEWQIEEQRHEAAAVDDVVTSRYLASDIGAHP